MQPRRRHYNDWLRAFVNHASVGEAPLSMYFWTGVVAVAGALRRNVWIDQAIFRWIPNFYVIFVAPPGIVSKSTTAAVGMNILRSVPGIKFGPDVVTWQALAQAFANALEFVEMPDGLQHGMSALTVEASELGNFLNPSDRDMVDFLITLWDGKKGAIEKLTKTQGKDVIESPCINLIACTTPAWIEGNFPEYVIGGGFTSRCVFIYTNQKRQYIAYPKLHAPKDFAETQIKLAEDLAQIASLRGEFVLLPETIEWGEMWYKKHYEVRPAHLNNDRFGGYLARKQTHMHKLAMVLSASRTDKMEITRDDLETAEKIITALEQDMPRVFEGIGTSDAARGAANLVARVRAAGKITRQGLFTMMFRELSYNDFEAALDGAIQAGYVITFQEDGQWWVKPRIT